MTRALLSAATALAIAFSASGSTGAQFTASQPNGGNSYSAKADWIPPLATMTDPGTPLAGTVALAATGDDGAGSGVQSVTIERSPAGAGTWTAVCTDTTSPYGCSFNTAAGATPDGLYDLRARALDNGANVGTSAVVANRRIDNTGPSVNVVDPGANLGGTPTISANASDLSGVASVVIQYKPTASGTWTTICTDTTAPYSCAFDTTTGASPDGLYDLRAIATDTVSNQTTSASITSRRIDNTPPTGVSMTDPGTPITGTKAFSGAATDSGSGLASVTFQYRTAGGGLWLDLCSDTTSPYGCSASTTLIADGLYDFRALATDNVGNTTGSTPWTNRRIDNTPPTVTMSDPGDYIRGTISLTATAADTGGSGVANVVIQRRTSPAGAWTTVCTDTTSPYSCSLNTTTLTSGTNYDFQAIATDNANNQATSLVTGRMVDNVVPTGVTLTNPGTPLAGTVTLSGGATDAHSGISTLTMQYSVAGLGTWNTACVASTSPYSCSFDTTPLTDGLYDFRTVAADRAGNTTNSATTANIRVDNVAPTVTMNDPGTYLRGTITTAATASDPGGIANVKIEYKLNTAGTWTLLCTDTSSPYSCSLNTTTLTSGSFYDFRATATDNANRVTVSTVVPSRQVDNAVPTGVVMNDPGTPLSGPVTFSGTATDPTPGSGIATVEFQYLYLGFIWTTACTATTSPYSCTVDTATLPDGNWSWRARATDFAGNQTLSATIAARRIDNTPPTATMSDPGVLSGTETLGATASDSGAGVTSVTIEYKLTSGSTWASVCTDTTSPYSCPLDTATLTEGEHYDFRAIAVDGANGTTTSAVVANKVVDNTAPTISFSAPAGPLTGSVALSSTATDTGSGIASVLYEYKPSSSSTWTTACTGASSPWGCSWASTGVTDGSYDLRATATDAAGFQAVSAVSTSRIVDNNTTPTGTDVQPTNGGATAGKAEVNDVITFTFSEPVQPGTILSGWNGTSQAVVVRIADNAANDRLTVWDSTDTAQTAMTAANGVTLNGDHVPAAGVKFNATMVMSGATVTITFTAVRSGSVNATATGNATAQWSPSSAVLDLANHALGTATVNESGTSDRNF